MPSICRFEPHSVVQALVGLVFLPAVLGQPDWSLRWELGFGSFTGVAEEIVYKQAGRPDKLSLLTWNVPWSLGVGSSGELSTPLGFFLRSSLMVGFPLTSTTMTDWDWLNVSDSDSPDIFSSSTAYLVGAFAMLFEFGWRPLPRFDLLVRYRYLLAAWEGWNSEQGQKGNPTTTKYYGHTIDYRQVWHAVGAGLGVDIPISEWEVGGRLWLYPWLLLDARDVHILTGTTYRDWALWGWGWGVESRFRRHHPFGFWGLTASLESLRSGYGNSLVSTNGQTDPAQAFTLLQGKIGGTWFSLSLCLWVGWMVE